MHSLTLGTTVCRHNKVVSGTSLEVLGEGNDGHLTQGGGGISIDQVGVRWVCTIVNGAGIPWFKRALHRCIGEVNLHPKDNIHATCMWIVTSNACE